MLVISRCVGETVMIGDSIKVTVVGINGNQAKIAVEAPREIEVHRQEVYERIHGDHAAATK